MPRHRKLLGKPICPNWRRHQEGPYAGTDRDEWIARMETNHVRSHCPDCGRFIIWTRKDGNK